MTNLLFEITSYDIPYDLQIKAENDIKYLLNTALKNLNIKFKPIISFSTNRRIVLFIPEIENTISSITTKKKGPAVNANVSIINSFLSANNITIEQCYKEVTSKGEYYFFDKISEGSSLKDKLANIITCEVLNKVTFKRSMFWNETKVRWARPITNLILMLGEDIIDFTFAGVKSSNEVKGHMFLSKKTISIKEAKEYFKVINDLNVILPANDDILNELSSNKLIMPEVEYLSSNREHIIVNEVNNFAKAHNIIPNLQPNLLKELLYLTEYPVVLFGKIPSKYLVLPKELLVDTMVKNQRYINFFNKDTNSISEHFALVANIKTLDNGKEIIKGNQRVLNARLEDGLFFYNLDVKENWSQNIDKLKEINFFEGLGSLFDKQERIKKLALMIFPNENFSKLCDFCKVDLTSKVVSEFPELQGIMGYYYAKMSGYSNEEALAIKEHYMPLNSNEELPTSLLGAKLAILDKLDTLKSFFSIGKQPTSSRDPFALRRAAVGIIRICIYHGINLNLNKIVDNKLLEFFTERLIIYLNSLDIKKDIITAVLNKDNFNISEIYNKSLALSECLQSNNDLIKLFKRVYNIINNENIDYEKINHDLFSHKEENVLFEALKELQNKYLEFFDDNLTNKMNSIPLVKYNNYIKDLLLLKPVMDSFLNNVHIINEDDPINTKNRLLLLKFSLNVLQKLGNLELIHTI